MNKYAIEVLKDELITQENIFNGLHTSDLGRLEAYSKCMQIKKSLKILNTII